MSIPDAPRALPLIGHLVPLARDRLAFLERLHAYGEMVWIRIGPWKALVITSADLSDRVLRDDRTFDKGGYLYDRIRETGGNGLVSCVHSDHRRQRRLVQPVFHRDRLPGYLGLLREQLDEVLGRWPDGGTVDVRADMQSITARTMLPRGLPPAVMERMLADMNVILAGVTWRSIVPKSLDRVPTPANRRYRRAQERLRGVVAGVIRDYREGGADHDDMLSGLLASYGSEGDDAEIHDQVLTFLLAGTETTANVVSWALHLVAQRPDIERRLRDEEDLARKVVLETMRLYPPVPVLTRITTKDTQLGGHDVPAGTAIAYSPYLVQRQSEHFKNPDSFDPDRWDDGKDVPRVPFLAFGGGARRCVGDTFGIAEAVLMLSAITSRWSLRPVRGSRVRPALSLVLTPKTLRMQAVAA